MSAIAIDTHEFFNQLKNVGFSVEQAEVIAQMHKTTASATIEQTKNEYHLDELIIKRDLNDAEGALRRDMKELELKIELVRAELREQIEKSKNELIKWFVGTAFAIASIGFMLARFMTHGVL